MRGVGKNVITGKILSCGRKAIRWQEHLDQKMRKLDNLSTERTASSASSPSRPWGLNLGSARTELPKYPQALPSGLVGLIRQGLGRCAVRTASARQSPQRAFVRFIQSFVSFTILRRF